MAKANVWVHGCFGRTGGAIYEHLREQTSEFDLVGGSGSGRIKWKDQAGEQANKVGLAQTLTSRDIQAVIDFSSVAGNQALLDALKEDVTVKFVLIGTTGLAPETLAAWEDLSRQKPLRVLIAPNTSLGILAMLQASQMLRRILGADYDVELVEAHHKRKVDAPSGTAKFLAQGISQAFSQQPLHLFSQRQAKREDGELGIHAIRGGGVFGTHEVMFLGEHEEISIKHVATTDDYLRKVRAS